MRPLSNPYGDRAQSVPVCPECEGYFSDEQSQFYIPAGNYLCRLCGEGKTNDRWGVDLQTLKEQWFPQLRTVVNKAIWREKQVTLDPVESRALDLVVTHGGPISRGQLYSALVRGPGRSSRSVWYQVCWPGSPRGVGTLLYMQLIGVKS